MQESLWASEAGSHRVCVWEEGWWGWGGGKVACFRDSVEIVSIFSLIWDVRGLFEPQCLPHAYLDL